MKNKLLAILYGSALFAAGNFGLAMAARSVEAAPIASSADVCEVVAKTETIIVWFCEPDGSPAFLLNSVGFMAPVE